jgi:putative oxidoreductase
MDAVPPLSPGGVVGKHVVSAHAGAPFLLLALTGGHILWLASMLRLPLAFAFFEAVADRLGLLGSSGPGVAWKEFIDYTAKINPFLPGSVIPAVAVLVTICEISLGLGLLFGVKIRFVALGAAALLFLFGTAMTTSGVSQFPYGVYLMAAGALALSTVDASLLSVDSLLRWRKKRQ